VIVDSVMSVDICCGCCCFVSGEGEVNEVLKQSKLPKLLEQVKSTFPNNTKAHEYANSALTNLAK